MLMWLILTFVSECRMFCSEPNYDGECRTFAPGDYATLPPGLDNRISSGRRISSDYPYNQPPNWGRP